MAVHNKKIRIITWVLVLLVIAGIVFYPKVRPLFQGNKGEGGPSSGQGAPGGPGGPGMRGGMGQQATLASGYVIVPTRMFDLIISNGTLLPDEEVELSFETSGKIVAIHFSEGTRVKQGQLLAKINDRPLQAQLLKLQAQKKLTEEKEFRARQLLDRDAVSRESYDQVATELQAIEADIMLVEARIAETELRAPFDGIVGLRMVSEGAFATTQTKIVRLVKTSPLKIEFSISERYAGEITPGFPITFTVDGVNQTFAANVYAIDPKVNIDTRMIAVRALYPNRNNELKPGRFGRITAQLSEIAEAIAIPTEAVIAEMEGERVFIYKGGKAELRMIDIGLRTESHVQVHSGLQFGDTLLTTAILQLRQGLPVQLDTLVTNQPMATPEKSANSETPAP
ncbi:MAG: efflux RND transporter periplasmic adaptor subunit [Prolixibacteraceae bacterium]|jgi:membrane fusion protein (multidrug efflux system)|nr:efflux RND transporter periplasmic adaptor subunit [Prolixibacteraceae bacterium]NLX29741.1 efflux RND transporter periplasmic adaptor subunit [Bacteroidales bacterium]HNQ37975.1 efflux RND transporter periplasmic adaptor subunit [Prolixibacteraceae bacterium]